VPDVTSDDPLLAGVQVLDLTTGIGGPVATLLLAEAGADVVRVEPRDDADRHRPGFATWNRSKRSIVAGGGDGSGVPDELLAVADVVVHELGPAAAREAGLDDASLAARHPRLVVCSVLGWPANHPDADRPVDELLTMARLGVLDEQFAMRGREGPVYVRFPLGSWGAAYLAAIGILARLRVRDRTGRGGGVHTSLVQGALAPLGMLWSRVERPTGGFAAGGLPKTERGSQATVFACGDGGWIHLMGNPAQSPFVAERLAAGDRLPDLLLTRARDEWLAELWAHDVPVQPALDFGAVLDDEQARANGYVVEVDDPELGRVTTPGNPLTMSPPCRVRGPAPARGADGDGVALAAEWQGRREVAPPSPSSPGDEPRQPLEGVRVLDFGAFLAGPYGPMLLADLGAEVVKVESTAGDGMRPVEWAFAGCQRGKRSVALDLKSPAARPALEALVRWADVVHLNLRMPAARRLGLAADDILALNPRAVYCHTSSYGPTGPRADWPGFDQLFQALCGWEVLGAGEGNPPMWHRFGFMDHQCALASVVAVLAALRRRDATGEGQVVAASLLGAGVLTTGEAVRRADGTLNPVATLDADQTGVAPLRRIVACRDGWVAVAGDEGDDGNAEPPVELPPGAEVLDTTVDELLAALATAGVPAERVREQQRDPFLDDAANRAAGLVAHLPHADWGALEQLGALWWFGDVDGLALRIDRAPPRLGEHTAAVLAEVGVADDEVRRLVDDGTAVALDLDPGPSRRTFAGCASSEES
jgi:crotonobetainyl-CoA:carnitine CoA-transferase CaiB-like acyl-CoA transferase